MTQFINPKKNVGYLVSASRTSQLRAFLCNKWNSQCSPHKTLWEQPLHIFFTQRGLWSCLQSLIGIRHPPCLKKVQWAQIVQQHCNHAHKHAHERRATLSFNVSIKQLKHFCIIAWKLFWRGNSAFFTENKILNGLQNYADHDCCILSLYKRIKHYWHLFLHL